jgi:hypothetical protein
MDKVDEGMQWGKISRWDRQCTWINEDERMQWGRI